MTNAPGRMIAVVGPSGVGKDSVMEGLAAADPRFHLVRRVITRAAGAGGEAFDAVAEDTFLRMAGEGAFCLHWQAHGLRYGIPHSVRQVLAQGRDGLVNLSRGVLDQAAQIFPHFIVLNLTARPETLAARVQARGRETAADMANRLSRTAPRYSSDLTVIDLPNDGALQDTIDAALARLSRVAAPS